MKKLSVWLLIAFFCQLLAGCKQSWYDARNVRRMDSYMIRYQAESSKVADQLFPCFNGQVKSDTIIQIGKADTSIGFSQLNHHFIPMPVDTAQTPFIIENGGTTIISDTLIKTVTIRVPVIKTIHDTVTNNRAVQACQLQLQQANTDKTQSDTKLADEQKAKKIWMIIAISAIVVIVISAAIWVYKTFFTGGGLLSAAKKII